MRTINFRLKKKMDEVFSLEPNNLNWSVFTDFYKLITSPLKSMPFLIVIPLSFIAAMIFYFIFNYWLIKLVSLLQHGF